MAWNDLWQNLTGQSTITAASTGGYQDLYNSQHIANTTATIATGQMGTYSGQNVYIQPMPPQPIPPKPMRAELKAYLAMRGWTEDTGASIKFMGHPNLTHEEYGTMPWYNAVSIELFLTEVLKVNHDE